MLSGAVYDITVGNGIGEGDDHLHRLRLATSAPRTPFQLPPEGRSEPLKPLKVVVDLHSSTHPLKTVEIRTPAIRPSRSRWCDASCGKVTASGRSRPPKLAIFGQAKWMV